MLYRYTAGTVGIPVVYENVAMSRRRGRARKHRAHTLSIDLTASWQPGHAAALLTRRRLIRMLRRPSGRAAA
eukprot:SAG31_NODE_26950_length_433_cov_2.011976_1_plen_71_part_10